MLGQNPYVDNDEIMEIRNLVGVMLDVDGISVSCAALHKIDGRAAKRSAEDAIDSVKLSEWADVKVAKYSQGMRKRLALARALVSDPQILILDEPTAGIDPESRYLIREMMRDLAANGKTLFFSSHDLDEVQKTCSHIAILNKGEIIANGALSDVLNKESSLEEAYLNLVR